LSACVAVALLYALQSYGVCLKKGRVLSPEELRKEVLLSFVNLRIRNRNAVAEILPGDFHRVAIGNSVSEVDIEKILEKIYLSEKSIEESLGLEPLGKIRPYRRAKPLSAEEIKEPFIFVRYESDTTYAPGLKIVKGSAKGSFVISSSFQEVDYDRKGFFSKLGLIRYFFKNPNYFYKILCGYNNYYYDFLGHSFNRECTDDMFADQNWQQECRKKRREGYEQRIEKLKDPQPPSVTAIQISNCGTILTGPHEMGFRTRYILSIYRKDIGSPIIRNNKGETQ